MASQYRPVGQSTHERRMAPRHRVVVTRATLHRQGEEPAEADLKDVSIYGCRIAAAEATLPGERLWLRFTGAVPVAATVVWYDGGVMACRFDEPIANRMARALTLAG